MRLALGAALLAIAALPAGVAIAQRAAPAPADLTARVQRTAEGGYRMGNPNAELKLVEYGSIACSHCAEFEEVAGDEIRDHVRAGRLSFEYRPYVVFPSDPGIFLLLECQGPDKFFSTLRSLYQSQATWTARLEPQMPSFYRELEQKPYAEVLPAIVRATGLESLFIEQGLSQQQIGACLAAPSAQQRIGETYRNARALGVEGTPTFFLNGEKLDLASWNDLLVRLRQP